MTRAGAFLVFAATLLFISHAGDAYGQGAVDGACPDGNLVRGASQTGAALTADRWALLTDGAVAREGAPWPGPDVIAVVHGSLTFELAQTSTLRQLYLQSDADQAVHVELSPDGVSWTRLLVPPHETASGMLSRTINLPGLTSRYVRVASPDGAAPVTLSELGLFCERRPHRERTLRVADDPATTSSGGFSRWTRLHPVSPAADDAIKLGLVLGAALWIVLDKRKRSRTLDAALVLLGLGAVLAYTNFGSYRYPDFLHEHDVFHYFVGAKYFPELGYDGLYECSAVAEADAGFPARVELRAQRDLRTNLLVGGAAALSHEDDCRKRFSPARWRAFASDVEYFAGSRTVEDWHRILKDHGFNASPTWIAFGSAVARPLPAAAWSIGRGDSLFAGVIGPLDPLLLLSALGAVVWAFGFRAAAMVAVVFGCNPLSEYSWVGGGFLRELWLATLVIGICLLKKDRVALGGATLALSASLQLFPGVCLFALGMALGTDVAARRPFDRRGLRALLAATAVVVALLPLSTWVVGRSDAWSAFAANTEKHAATPSGNLVGLPTALSFRMSTRASLLFDENATDPFARVRRARHDNLSPLWPLHFLGIALGLFALYRCLRRRPEPWLAAALGLTLVPLFIETSCYYSAWLAALVLAGAPGWERALPVLGILAVSLGLSLGVSELDVSSAFSSFALLGGAFGVSLLSAKDRDATPTTATQA